MGILEVASIKHLDMQFSIKMMTPFFVKSDPFNFGVIVIYYTSPFPHTLPCLIHHRGARGGLPAGLCPVGQAAVAPNAVCPIAGVVGARAAEHCGDRGRESAALSSKAAAYFTWRLHFQRFCFL